MRGIKFSELEISSLGFGCTQLTANFTEKAAISNLETAFQGGITHFDVARVYGFGMAESILGKFIADKRGKLTVTSKIGLLPSFMPIRNLFLLNVVRSSINAMPFLKRNVIESTNGLRQELIFSPENAERSLMTSLHSLKTDYLDFLLLHESNLATANREDVIGFLKYKVKEGKIRYFGIASHYDKLPEDFAEINPAYDIIQYEAAPLVDRPFKNKSSRLIILHSIFRRLEFFKIMLDSKPVLTKSLSEIMDVDMSLKQNISYYLMQYAQKINPQGIGLFTSKNDQRIKNNIRYWHMPLFTPVQMEAAIQKLEIYFENEFGKSLTQ